MSQAESSFSPVCEALWGDCLDGHQTISILMIDSKDLKMNPEKNVFFEQVFKSLVHPSHSFANNDSFLNREAMIFLFNQNSTWNQKI